MATTALATVLHNLRRSLLRQEATGLTDGELLECFIARRDETAFEVLMQRHGPMVLGACRRVLRNETDAEDAFQATFLVLVRKAASIRPRGMVGNWLYGVAHTTSLKARAMSIKRLAKEREAVAQPKPEVESDTWEHLHSLLDQELKVLPDKYRAAIVLCDLEGKSIKEAARQLGCPQGTVGTRLTRGRNLLSRRLARHGLTLSGGAIATMIAQNAVAAGVPSLLLTSTIEAAALVAAGPAAAAGIISTKVAALTEGVVKAMLMHKLGKILSVLAVAGLTLCWAGAELRHTLAGEEPPAKLANPLAKPGALNKNAVEPGNGVLLLGEKQYVKVELRGVLQHSELAKLAKKERFGIPPTHPWTISARGVSFAVDFSKSAVFLDLDKKRFHGKEFIAKGMLEGGKGMLEDILADSQPVFVVESLTPVDR